MSMRRKLSPVLNDRNNRLSTGRAESLLLVHVKEWEDQRAGSERRACKTRAGGYPEHERAKMLL